MIKIDKISKEFVTSVTGAKFFALRGVSFFLEEGALIGFLGANGAGKTTLIKILLKFIFPTKGHIIFSEKLFGQGAKEFFSKVAYVPERPYFYPDLTGLEFLFYMGSLSNIKRSDILGKIKTWGERFQIAFALERRMKTYSKGMLSRLGMLSGLIHDPILLILDEPLSGLDPLGRKEIKDALKDLNLEGKTVFFSSHILSDVEEICSKVVFLEKGELAYEGSIENLMQSESVCDFELTYIQNGKTVGQILRADEKDRVLAELIKSGAQIYSLSSKKLSLEEIIYKTRKEKV